MYRTEMKPKCAAITPQMLHGQGDHLIRRSLNEGYAESYIFCPGTIVVTRRAPIPSAPFFFYFMIQVALEFVYIRRAPTSSIWCSLKTSLSTYLHPTKPRQRQGKPCARHYLAVSTLMSWRHIMAIFSCVVKRSGKLEDANTYSVPPRDATNWQEDEDERSIPTDNDNPKLQLRNDDIGALPMINDVNLLFEASLRRPRVRGQSLNSSISGAYFTLSATSSGTPDYER
ncbi:hypothetical protein EI94DRAFT_734099 [Lactarius quietus]|nr:hypothetical protein EI94DRAFT_734099 [Lactarius quietus]